MESHTTASTLPRSQSSPNGVPSTSTFSFKAPFPVSSPASAAAVSALKQRRVSLASPSSPRLVKPFSFRDEMGLQTSDTVTSTSASTSLPEKKGKMRKIDPATKSDDSLPIAMPVAEKKPRKKWSSEETQMLVEGCRIHGVGNWKTILQDPDLKFHDRSAVDLKDRFRTYFPDAYKKHYPNAKTHLSSKIRSTFADGTSLFEKTRSKRRRPFTDAEDRALKAGYEKHGTTWAAIVKDPIFQEQNRRSTDLRDRFRNAFPLLYQAAGYKPRTTSKKKVDTPVRAADDQLATTTGPIRSRRKAQASQGLRGGTKSVPQSTACSEDEESSAGEEDNETYIFKKPPTPIFIDSNPNFRVLKRPLATQSMPATLSATSASVTNNGDEITETNDDMDLAADADPLNIPDFLPNSTHSDLETWSSSGLNTPTHSSTAAWSTAAASPTSSHVSDFFMSAASGASNDASNSSSPFIQRRNDILGNNFGMIGKSAWGTQDWFSPNPKLESSRSSTSSSSFIDSSFSPASPFTYHPHLNHGVLDRYDLFPPSMPDGNSSEAGYGDTHATFFDDIGGVPGSNAASSGGTGFKGYHSPFAGDLISGTTTSRMHTSTSFSSSAMSLASLPSIYGSSFSSGFGNGSSSVGMGLGLENIPEDGSIHPMQLHSHSHTPSLLSIDELGLTGISLNDHDSSSTTGTSGAGDNGRDATMDDSPLQGRQDLMSLAFAMPHSSSPEKHKQEDSDLEDMNNSLHSDSFGLDDLVDMNELHATPPATPVLTQPRPLRRSSGGAMLHSFDHSSMGGGSGNSHHARSISVPPSEARNSSGPTLGGMTMSMDDVGLHMHQAYSGMHEMNLSSLTGAGRNLQALFNPNFSSPSTSPSLNLNVNVHSHNQQQTPEHIRMSDSSGSLHSPMSTMSPILRHQQHQQSQHHQQTLQQPRTIFPGNLMLSPSSPQALSSPNSSDPRTLNHHLQMNDNHNINSSDPWRNTVIPGVDYSYNLPFLDLHYYMLQGNQHGISVDGTLDDHSEARQGQALDLAQSAALTSSASSLSSALSFKGLFEPTPSPVGTIRQHASSKSTGLPPSFMSSLSINPAALTGSGSTDPVSQHDTAKSRMQNDTRTIRQLQIKSSASGSGGATVNRSMSHHRGQSAVCPQDLMLRNDNKRKRASWDGGLA